MNDLSLTRAPLPYKITLPEGLKLAWPHLVMFLVLSTAKQHRGAFYELAKFRELAFGSRMELMKSLARESLHRREAVLPLGITSLVIKNLLKDVTLGLPSITSTYSECFERLVKSTIPNEARQYGSQVLYRDWSCRRIPIAVSIKKRS